MNHRILPANARGDPRQIRPIHRVEILGAILFLGIFAIFSALVLLSRLNPAILTGHAENASVATTVNITNGTIFTCDYTFVPGTSLASFPCLPPSITRDEFFANLSAGGSGVQAIYAYTPSTDGKWRVYNASLPNYTVQSLTALGQLEGYYFVMDGNDRLVYEGYLPKSTPIFLFPGWNLVAYPSNATRDLASAIATINASYEEIKTLEGTEQSGTYLVDYPPPGGETLTNMSLYHGYWILMNASATWTVGP